MPKFLVEAISVHRMRYAVEADSSEEAGRVINEKYIPIELSQKHLGEHVSSVKEFTKTEIIKTYLDDNPHIQYFYEREKWSDDKILERILNKLEDLENDNDDQ